MNLVKENIPIASELQMYVLSWTKMKRIMPKTVLLAKAFFLKNAGKKKKKKKKKRLEKLHQLIVVKLSDTNATIIFKIVC